MTKQSKAILVDYNKCPDLAVRWQNILDSFFHKDEGKIVKTVAQDADNITITLDDNSTIVIPLKDPFFKGKHISLAALTIAYPAPEDGSYAHIDEGVGKDIQNATWDADDSKWVIGSSAAVDLSAPAISVVLSAGKTLGKYANGQTVPAAATIQAQLADIAQELTLPTFNLPTAALSASIVPNSATEVGTSISPDLTAVLTPNDSGAANQYLIKKDGIAILTDPVLNHIINTIVLGTVPIVFQGVIDYNAGTTPKNDSLGNPVANTIVAGSTNSNTLSYRGYRKIFFGATATIAGTSAQVRALASNRFENAGNVFNLATGNTQLNFQFWLPTGVNLVSVIDLDALNANITASYITSALSVNDAGGTPIAGTLYTLTQGVPYSTSHNHQITIS